MNEAAVPVPFVEPAAPEPARVVTTTGTGEAVGVAVGVEVVVAVDVQGVLLALTQGGTVVAVKVTVGGRATGAVMLEDFVHD
jgi:hypothetical protein